MSVAEMIADEGPVVVAYGLLTGNRVVYSGITPREAVIAAYAQSRGDWNTWDYAKRYGHLVRTHKEIVSCGEDTNIWSALRGEA